MIEALECPTCGGPVRVRAAETLTICLYCNGALKIARVESGDAHVEVDSTISGETIDRIKELVIQGKRPEAVTVYRDAAKCDQAAAEAAIETYVASAVTTTIFSATLNTFGMFLYLGAIALVVSGIVFWVRGVLPGIVCVIQIALGSINLLVLTKGALKTVRYLAATRGEAVILRHALIGKNGDVSSFLMLLEVTGPSGAKFVTEVAFPASKTGAAKIKVGRRFRVKYFPGDPTSVVFAGNIES